MARTLGLTLANYAIGGAIALGALVLFGTAGLHTVLVAAGVVTVVSWIRR